MMSDNLTGTLIENIRQLSVDVAEFLLECEGVLRVPSADGGHGSGIIDPATDHEENLIQQERIKHWRNPRRFKTVDPAFFERTGHHRRIEGPAVDHWDPQRLERRLAGLVFAEWERLANAEGRRPDVLHVTASLISNPSKPFTFRLATFGTVLGLRSQYGIRSERTDLRRLDDGYRSLTSRLSQRTASVLDPCESFLLDVCCLHSFLFKSLGSGPQGHENLSGYYRAFKQFPFGVATDRERGTAVRRSFQVMAKMSWEGELPAFSLLLNLIFNQPLGIPGLDDALGGLRPPFRAPSRDSTTEGTSQATGGGLVTLIAGPAGVGKTTISIAFASRMAEFGADVRYIATEESEMDLLTKRTIVGERFLADSIWPLGMASRSFGDRLRIHSGDGLATLSDAVDDLIGPLEGNQKKVGAPGRGEVYLDFPYVVVIDSVASLLDARESTDAGSRRNLADLIRRLRAARVCVFLVGERQHMKDARLAYLVDNVLTLDLEETEVLRRPLRLLSIEKTRHQISHRGKHVFHISRFNGPVVSLALQAVLAETADLPSVEPSSAQERVAVLCVSDRDENRPSVIVPANAQCLLYGWGSSGKAQIALALALYPTVTGALQEAAQVARRDGAFDSSELVIIKRARILVISFLFDSAYYMRIAQPLLDGFGITPSEPATKRVTVLNFYPGFLDPETFIGRIRDHVFGAMLRGDPYSAVVIDGIQNMLLQFPRLSKEELLWPTLYRVLRSYGVRAISTVTFFSMLGSEAPQEPEEHVTRASMLPSEAQRMLHHLVVGSSDFGMYVVRENQERARLICTNTATTVSRGVAEFYWDRSRLRFACA
jgi:KaiC/GvpD/RAD55 family RecA-like ATPase